MKKPLSYIYSSETNRRLANATAATAQLIFNMNNGDDDASMWVRWSFAIEALPVFDAKSIGRVRSLACRAITESPQGVTTWDVKHCYRDVSSKLR